jgi:hypothetical protein
VFVLEAGLDNVINFGSTRFRLFSLPSPPLTDDDMAAGDSLSTQYANLFSSAKADARDNSNEVRILLSNHLPYHDMLYPKLAQYLNVSFSFFAVLCLFLVTFFYLNYQSKG